MSCLFSLGGICAWVSGPGKRPGSLGDYVQPNKPLDSEETITGKDPRLVVADARGQTGYAPISY